MKSKFVVSVLILFFGITTTSFAQQKKYKKHYHNGHYYSKGHYYKGHYHRVYYHRAPAPPALVVILPPAPPRPVVVKPPLPPLPPRPRIRHH